MHYPPLPNPRRGRIQHRLMVWGLGLLALALLINTLAGSLYTRRGMLESTARSQNEVALFTALRMQTFLRREIEGLKVTGAAMMLFPFGGEQQRRLANSLLQNGGSLEEIVIIDRFGQMALWLSASESKPPARLKNFRNSPEFFAAAAGKYFLKATPAARPYEPSWVTIAVPLAEREGKVVGVLTARIKLDFLRQAIVDVHFGHRGSAYVVDDTGLMIAHSDPSYALVKRNLGDLSKVREFLAGNSADVNPATEAVGIADNKVLTTYARIPDLGWGIIVEEPVDAVMAKLQDLYLHALALLGAGLLVGAIIIVWLSRRITRPIHELRDSIESIRQGERAHRAEVQTGDEIEDLADEFNHMTMALEQSRVTLEQRVEQRTQEITALYEITAMVSQSLDVEAVLDMVIKKITALFGFDSTRVYLIDPEIDVISLRGCFEVKPEPWVSLSSFRRGQGIIGRVVETGQPLIFADLANDAASRQLSESHDDEIPSMGFLAAFPVKTKHSCYGALAFSAVSSRSLRTEEIQLLSAMAEQIGVAVENSTLYQQARSKSEHLTVLNEVAAAVSRSLDLETVLREALDKVVGVLEFDAAWVYLLEAKDQRLHLKSHKGVSSETAQMLSAQSARSGIRKTVISSGRRLALEDGPEGNYQRAASTSNRIHPRGYRGSIAVPIKTRENIIGVLYAVNWENRRYTGDDLRLIESVAQEIAVAVENAKLFAELKKQSAELEKINEELRAATQAKSDFIAAMSHELRTPLNIMIGNADVAHDGIFGEINDEQKLAMRKIARNGRVLLKMINDLLKLSRLEANRMTLEAAPVEVNEILQHARDHVAQLNRDGHLEIVWHVEERLPRLFTDPVKLEEILHNLIGNAFKFTARGRIDISVGYQPHPGRVEFSVSDTGVGIDSSNLERVFEKFEQIKSPGKNKNDGVGLGLSIVKKYLDLMQGGIRVDSTPGKGSKFTFWLPCSVSNAPADAPPNANDLTSKAGNG